MEVYDHGGERKEMYYKNRSRELLDAKMAELVKTKEELKNARDNATQSWLDSRPIIDELEKLQGELASVKNRTSMSKIVIAELKSQLESIDTDIRSKKEEELKAMKLFKERNSELDQTRKELENIKKLSEEERAARTKLKQVLRMRRQTLRALQLTLRAVRIESDAFGASLAEAEKYTKREDTDTRSTSPSTIKLTQEEYHALTKRAKEEASLAEWRIAVSMEQRLAAEGSKNSALSGLRGLYTEQVSSRRNTRTETTPEDNQSFVEEEEQEEEEEAEEKVRTRDVVFPKARAAVAAKSNKRNHGNRKQKVSRSGSNVQARLLNKKKHVSILHKIKSFLDSIGRFFK